MQLLPPVQLALSTGLPVLDDAGQPNTPAASLCLFRFVLPEGNGEERVQLYVEGRSQVWPRVDTHISVIRYMEYLVLLDVAILT